jgi:hypothetical protein
MADPTTWIDVADNAVKIGLGALLGGAFAIWRARVSNQNQAKKVLLEKKRDKMEKVLEEVDTFFASASVFWADLSNAVYKRENGQKLTTTEAHDLKTLEQRLFEDFKLLGYGSSRLVLIGEEDAEKALQDMRKAVDDFFQIANIDNPKCTQPVLDKHKDCMQTARRAFFDKLSASYRRGE